MRAVEGQPGDVRARNDERVAQRNDPGADLGRKIGDAARQLPEREPPLGVVEREPDRAEPYATAGKPLAVAKSGRREVDATRVDQRPASSTGIEATAAIAVSVAGAADGAP